MATKKITTKDCVDYIINFYADKLDDKLTKSKNWKRISKSGSDVIERIFLNKINNTKVKVLEENNKITNLIVLDDKVELGEKVSLTKKEDFINTLFDTINKNGGETEVYGVGSGGARITLGGLMNDDLSGSGLIKLNNPNKPEVKKEPVKQLNKKTTEEIEYDNGKTKSIKHFLNGHLHRDKNQPAVIEYFEGGNIKKEMYYLNGVLHNEDGLAIKEYNEKGRIISEKYYINGKNFNKSDFQSVAANNKFLRDL